MARLRDRRGRPASSWDGNLVFRVRTPTGSVIHKVYRDSHGPLSLVVRNLLVRFGRAKTGIDARSRWRTERDVLAVWRAAGFDVPADLSAAHPELAGPLRLVLEDVPGGPLLPLLSRAALVPLPREQRDDVLCRFGAEWCRRHAAALAGREPRLIQEHGGFQHVLVQGERLVHIDFEQAFLRPTNLRAKIAREIAGYLRSLYKRTEPDDFRADVEALVEGYADRDFLAACAGEYLSNEGVGWRAVWAVDRRLRKLGMRGGKKYAALRILADVLGGPSAAAAAAPLSPSAA